MSRIGIVTGEYPPMQGGVGDFSRELAVALCALGHEVHVLTHAGATTSLPNAAPVVHPVIRAWTLPALFAIRRLARSLALDVINIQYQAAAYGLGLPIHLLPRLAGVPSVVTFHDLRLPYLFPKAGPLRRGAVLHLARSASGAIVTNSEDRRTLERAGGVRTLAEIPIGSNIAPAPPPGYDRDAWRAARRAGRSDLLIGYFGFLNASKGGDTLLRALALLPDARLLLIGGRTGASDPTNTAYAAELGALANELGIADRIVRTDYLPPAETSEALLACDVMAMPYADGASFRRGTFMAALAHGCPTVTTRPAVSLPQLQHGHNVMLVPPRDPAALAESIRAVWANPALRARLSAGASALAGSFAWDKIAAQTAAFFETAAHR
ncbi:MAG: glycosyltransferase family 4 protein [Chloroflexi bacterium]|nr:glycosyltransferase family 4 protein [Chloroflexota bacterium]